MLGKPETPYLAAIGALMYLANCTRPDIAFAANLLAGFSDRPTKRHGNGVKHILRYLKGIEDSLLFYKAGEDSNIKGYVDAGYPKGKHSMFAIVLYVERKGNMHPRIL